MLHSLTDPLTFSTDNTEDAVADFDDRLKRAGAKAKVIERSIGEDGSHSASDSPSHSLPRGKSGGDPAKGEVRKKEARDDNNFEDFAGSRLLR